MKKILFILFLSFFSLPLFSAITTLTGTISGIQSGKIRLVVYEDQVSYQKKTIAQAEISDDSRFSMSVELANTTYALLDFNFQQVEVFLEPGLTYQMNLMPEENADKKAYFDRPVMGIVLLEEPGNRINNRISQVNEIYNDFLLNNAHLLQHPSRKEKVDQVIIDLNALAGPNPDPYLSNYLRYKIASMEMFFRIKSNEKLASVYLTGQPVLYGNVEYMDFFHLYFEKYLLTNNPYLPFSKTSSLINENTSLNDVLMELGKDPVLSDARLAELVLMEGMKDMAATPGFKTERIETLLDEMSSQSKFEEHRIIAKNLKNRMFWMKPGSPAPAFDLSDVLGGVHKLEDYRGKYLYLSFINLYSPASLSEMNLLADIYKDYRDRVNFASIVVDDLRPGWSQLTKDYRMDWDLLLARENIDLIENYGATAPPIFILIDPDGNIVRYPAPSPSEELRNVLDLF